MLRTNNKKVIEAVRNYLIKNALEYAMEQAEYIRNYSPNFDLEEPKNWVIKCLKVDDLNKHTELDKDLEFKMCASLIKQTILCEYGHLINKNYLTYSDFKEYLQGLPSVIDTNYYYNRSAVQQLGEWLEETESERNKYSESQAEELITKLIFKELSKVWARV